MKGLLKYLLLLTFAFVAPPATAALWQWSSTPATNTGADPSINWTIGMPPSAVGPSMRSMMSRTAEWRDDISGALLTTGSSTAYAVTTNEAAAGNGICAVVGGAPVDGQTITITPNVTNALGLVLTVDSCAGSQVESAPATIVPAGTLNAFTPYTLKYSLSQNSWMLHNFYGNPIALPLGAMMPYTGSSPPSVNYVFPAGQCLSTTTYVAYWTLLGSPGVGGCSAGNFPVIDLRGRTLAALDNLNGTAASLMTNAAAGCGTTFTSVGTVCASGAESQTLTLAQTPTGITFANGAQSVSLNGNGATTLIFDGSISSFLTVSSSAGPTGGAFGGASAFSFSGSNAISGTSNNTGGAARPKVQPSVAVSYILRVL
jgi:hypothetical protein